MCRNYKVIIANSLEIFNSTLTFSIYPKFFISFRNFYLIPIF
nr:MAG TPA: hypothetical protein [Bacteriophage sp.]